MWLRESVARFIWNLKSLINFINNLKFTLSATRRDWMSLSRGWVRLDSTLKNNIWLQCRKYIGSRERKHGTLLLK